ncbi:MAG: hypothetical protein NUV54_01325 [Candidatus Taylorbacteria bacterium]|nr:hypothetical protein [Candidatus Taylorbacteria bacterium]
MGQLNTILLFEAGDSFEHKLLAKFGHGCGTSSPLAGTKNAPLMGRNDGSCIFFWISSFYETKNPSWGLGSQKNPISLLISVVL